MNVEQYRRLWLKLHKSYEKKAFSIFRRALKDAAKKIPFDNLDKYNYIPSIEFNVSQNDIYKAYYKAYYDIGLLYGNRVTRGIVRDTKGFEVDVFQQAFKNQLQQWLIENAGTRIVTVRDSLIKHLIGEIQKGVAEGYDVREISKRIEKLVNSRNFYRWQAMRIARTETTAAANYGASIASGSSIYVMEKVWVSSNDARTRRPPKSKYDHLDLHLKKVGEKELFEDNGAFLRFPGDPNAPAGTVINCRCTVGLQPKRDANGRLIRKGSVITNTNPIPSIVPKPNIIPKPTTNITPTSFKPAKSLSDAENRIKSLGVKNVNLKGLKSNEFNEVLKIMEKEASFSGLSKLDTLETFRKSTSRGLAYYSPSNRKISLNLSHIKKYEKQVLLSFEDQIKNQTNLVDKYTTEFLGNPKYNQNKVNSRINSLKRNINKIDTKIKLGEKPKYWSVSYMEDNHVQSLGRTLTHEIGHFRHYEQFKINALFRFNPSMSITEYGTTNQKEYLAEWYAYYRKNGEKDIPEDLLKLFKSIML